MIRMTREGVVGAQRDKSTTPAVPVWLISNHETRV